MKILFINSGFGKINRGVETWVAALAKEFKAMGHEVTIFTGHKSDVKPKGIHIEKFGIIYRDKFKIISKIKYGDMVSYWLENLSLTATSFCRLKKRDFDVIFISSWSDGFSTSFLKAFGLIKSKIIYTFHGGTANKLLLPLVFPAKFADIVVGVSNFVAKNASAMLKREVEVIYNGVDMHQFRPMAKKRDLICCMSAHY